VKKIKIIADDKIPFLEGVFENVADIRYYPAKDIDKDKVRDADALIIRTRTHCNRELLKGSSVKFIASATIGYDHIDTAYCREKGIQWTNAPGCNAASVEQYVVSVLLNLALTHGFDLKTKTLGVVGVGNVGSKVAGAAGILGMRVLLNDPPRAREEGSTGFVTFDTIVAQSDIVTFHVPLNRGGEDNTFHLADERFFGRLNAGIYLINTSRGEVVDGNALALAIRNGRIQAACLDVWEHEPGISPELLDMVDLATPHIAGYSLDGKANGTTMSVRAVSAFFDLGLDNWSPGDIPVPRESMSLVIDCTGMNETEILTEVYHASYDVKSDDEALRKDVSRFEYLRGNYPVRREPPAWSVRLINNPYDNLPGIFEQLGFSVLETSCFC